LQVEFWSARIKASFATPHSSCSTSDEFDQLFICINNWIAHLSLTIAQLDPHRCASAYMYVTDIGVVKQRLQTTKPKNMSYGCAHQLALLHIVENTSALASTSSTQTSTLCCCRTSSKIPFLGDTEVAITNCVSGNAFIR
jgi:hypothetical protein